MIEFTWDERKARRNERIHGVSFPVAQAALESRLGIEVGEQFRDGEWRTLVVAPFRGMLLLHITLKFYGRGDYEDGTERTDAAGGYEDPAQDWSGEDGVIRLISAREATAGEQAIYFESRPQTMG